MLENQYHEMQAEQEMEQQEEEAFYQHQLETFVQNGEYQKEPRETQVQMLHSFHANMHDYQHKMASITQ